MTFGSRRLWLVLSTLILNPIVFFSRPLFSNQYIFPWDFRYVQLPLITFLADQLKDGRLALWDPYTYCGNPIFANIQASFFHPLVILGAALSNVAGQGSLTHILEWIVVLQVCVAGIFMYFLARHIGATESGAWAAAVICETGSYFASRTEHMGVMMAVAWMPAAWFAVIRMRHVSCLRWFALLATALGMAVFGGFPAATAAVFGSTVTLSIILFAARLGNAANVLRTVLACACGIGVSAVTFIPATQLAANSVAKYRLDWLGRGGGLKWQSLVSLVRPNYYHIFDLKNFAGPWDPSFLYLYCSLAGLALVIFVLVWKRDRWVVCFGSLAFLGFLMMMGDSLPFWDYIYPLVPARVRIGIHPEYTYCIFEHCLAILAGLGLSRLPFSRLRIGSTLQWSIALIIALDLYLTGANRPMNCASLRDEPGLTDQAMDGSPRLLQVVRRLTSQTMPPARIDTIGASIDWAECAPLTRVATGSGASPLAQERIIQIRLGVHDGGRAGWYYPVAKLDSPMLDLMSEGYLLAGSSEAASVAGHARFQEVADLPGNILFRNLTAFPRAFAVPRVEELSLERAALRLRSAGFDARMLATIEPGSDAPFPSSLLTSGTIHSTAQFTEYSPAHLALTASTDQPALLILTEAWYPGWEARLDNKPVPIYIADVAFRGIFLPQGEHTLVMDFRPRILPWSFAISLAFALALLGLCVSHADPEGKPRERTGLNQAPAIRPAGAGGDGRVGEQRGVVENKCSRERPGEGKHRQEAQHFGSRSRYPTTLERPDTLKRPRIERDSQNHALRFFGREGERRVRTSTRSRR